MNKDSRNNMSILIENLNLFLLKFYKKLTESFIVFERNLYESEFREY
jgi:hypothetical protein